jgi:hypothetical protein
MITAKEQSSNGYTEMCDSVVPEPDYLADMLEVAIGFLGFMLPSPTVTQDATVQPDIAMELCTDTGFVLIDVK